MVAKNKIRYVCSECGAIHTSWSGKCSSCGQWNTLEETLPEVNAASLTGRKLQHKQIAEWKTSDISRLSSGGKDLDSVLGGGFVPGSVILLAGEPGIGKSTLLLQIANEIAKSSKVLYVSGEESEHQVSLRAQRLKLSSKLELATSNSADDVSATISSDNFSFVIVDSIQTMSCAQLSSSAGTVSQISGSTQLLSNAAKRSNTVIILVGHVTKEGSIAGPKILEHSVDVVLQLEGDRYGGFKILRSAKNRFGSTNESVIYEMKETGMKIVSNPSAELLSERMVTDGSIVLATLEGSRPLLVEIQALVNPTSYGYPKRTASGLDINRVNLLIAVLERRTKLSLATKDIFINVVGGIKLTEPASDLAVCMAIASAEKSLKLSKNSVVFGEVGLSGEIRHVPFVEKRINEAKKLGFDGAIGPNNLVKDSFCEGVSDLKSALNTYLKK